MEVGVKEVDGSNTRSTARIVLAVFREQAKAEYPPFHFEPLFKFENGGRSCSYQAHLFACLVLVLAQADDFSVSIRHTCGPVILQTIASASCADRIVKISFHKK
jgi:hypothetical protein